MMRGASWGVTEYQVKAAFLLNFGKYVEWPSAAVGDALDICVLGEDPFGSTLEETVAGRSVGKRKVKTRRVSDASGAQGCNILFVCSSEADRVDEILKKVDGLPILTVGETAGFVESGGGIEFMVKDDRVRIRVNTGVTDDLGLVVNPRLLKIAEIYPGSGAKRGRTDSSP